MELAGAGVLLTGASTGIGAATAEELAGRGARLALVSRRRELLDQVAATFRTLGSPEVVVLPADLGDLAAATRVAGDAWDALGGLDAVVNNAGIPKRRRVVLLTAAEVEEVMRVNYLSPVSIMLALLPRMCERGHGMVVNVGSLAGRLGSPQEAAYSGSKFALSGFTETAAVDLAGSGVELRLVQPGPIETPIWGDVPGNDPPIYSGPMFPARDVALAIVAALTEPGFERFVPPDLGQVVAFKAANIDTFLTGAAAFAANEPLPEGTDLPVPDSMFGDGTSGG
ncbi:MAG: SDR family NAD(P)-dependent oxidoreductase [Mycobacteriales bacterium]